jgi:hypothetical protein
MEDLRKEDSEEQLKDFSTADNPLDTSVEGIAAEETTAGGEEGVQGASSDPTGADYPDDSQHRGSRELIDRYNINDQAHSDSSKDDFVKTVSNATHADGTDGSKDGSSG